MMDFYFVTTIVATLLMIIAFLLGVIKKKRTYAFDSRLLLIFTIVVFGLGMWTYWIGLGQLHMYQYCLFCHYKGICSKNLYLCIASFYGSLKMFLGGDLLSNFGVTVQYLGWKYLIGFYCVHLMALLITATLVINFLGFRLWNGIKMLFLAMFAKSKNIFIFWGTNVNTLLLAKDIVEKSQETNVQENLKNSRFILVTTYQDSDEQGTLSARKLFRIIKRTPQYRDVVSNTSTYSVVADSDWAEWNLENNICSDIWKQSMHLSALKRIIKRAVNVHIFFLEEEETHNINSCINIINDEAIIKRVATPKLQTTIYVHARQRKSNRWMEYYDLQYSNNIHIKLVDSSKLTIDWLRIKKEHQPAFKVNIAADATTEDAIESLIIGFGETGKDAFRFMYEFGALLSKNGKRNPFHCHIIDRTPDNMDAFFAERPAINALRAKDPSFIIKKCMDCQSTEFVQDVENYITKLNYVFVTLNDDYLGLSIANLLFRTACKKLGTKSTTDKPLKNFRIYLRCYNANNELRMQQAIDEINRTLAYSGGEIVLIGKPRQIFTYNLIVNDKLMEDGKKFYEEYALVAHQNETWEERRRKVKDKDIFDIENLLRKESQDMANARHIETKVHLLEEAVRHSLEGYTLSNADWDVLSHLTHEGEMKEATDISDIHYKCSGFAEEHINQWMSSLAQTEHLRWNAAHELLGYTFKPNATGSDALLLTHNCLTDWNDLPEISQRSWEQSWKTDYQLADYRAVETTFIINSMNKKQ